MEGDKTFYIPILQSAQQVPQTPGLEVPSHCVFHLKLLLLLIQFSTEDIKVDSIDDQVLQLSDVGDLEGGEEVGVGEDASLHGEGDEGEVAEFGYLGLGEWWDGVFVFCWTISLIIKKKWVDERCTYGGNLDRFYRRRAVEACRTRNVLDYSRAIRTVSIATYQTR